MTPDAAVAEVRRYLVATPERVFSAFANAQMVSCWLTLSPEIKLSVVEFDFRVGGAYRFAYHAPNGRIMTVNGIFRFIEPPDEHARLHSEVHVKITQQSARSRIGGLSSIRDRRRSVPRWQVRDNRAQALEMPPVVVRRTAVVGPHRNSVPSSHLLRMSVASSCGRRKGLDRLHRRG